MKRRVLAILTALVMFISAVGVPSVSKAQTTGPVWQWTRLAGKDRYLTMEQVVQTAYKDGSCKNLIVATASSFPDALSGSALAGVLGCPIILTTKASLSAPAASEIKRLASPDGCELFILGGKGAVSQAAEDAIVALGIEKLTVERVKGSNREATAKAVYEKGVEKGGFAEGGTVIISTGYAFADVLSISPYAYAAKTPIVLTQKGGALSDETKDLIRTINPSKALLIGGKSAVNADSEQYLTDLGLKVYRLKGGTRYGTSAAIMNWELGLDTEAPFQPDVKLSVQGMGIATGRNFADALGAVSLLGKTKSVLLLVADNNDDNLADTEANIANLIAPNASKMNKGYIFGGKGAVSLSLEEKLNAVIPTTTIYETPEEIVTAAYALGNGEVLSEGHEYELTGKITKINATYSASFNNVSVTFAVEGLEDKPIQAYRLTAAPADTAMQEALPKLKIGDTIKVKGTLKRYNASTVEFDAGCILLEYTEDTSAIIYETPEEIVNALYALPGDNDVLSGGHVYELTGKITKIVTPYDQGYKNVTVEIVVGDMTDKPIECFRMKTEVEELKDVIASLNPDDTITVKGVLKKYNGKPEFDANCLMTAYTSGGGTGPTIYETPEEILKALYALGDNEFLSNGHVYELEGKITEVIEAYNEEYKNATVEIVVGEWTEYPVVAFRMKAEADDMKEAILKLKVGDTIKVQGKLKNFVKDGESTKEFDSGCLLIAYTAGETPGMTDREKVEHEASQLSIPDDFTEAQVYTFPTAKDYPEVEISWSSDSELAVVDNTAGTLTVTLPEDEDTDVNIVATLTLPEWTATVPFVVTIRKANTEPPVIYETVQEILEALYALEGDGEYLSGGYEYTLEGTISMVNKAYANGVITVTIVMDGFDLYPVQCYNLTAEDTNTEMLAALAVLKKGDTIKVKGKLKNYINSYTGETTKEFDAGCLLLDYTAAPEPENVTWTKVEWDAITAEDVIAITMTKGDETWVLPGTNGTTSAPTAVKVTVADNKITTKGSEEYGWIKEAVEAGGFSLRLAAATTDKYLYFYKDDNNGVRVGSTEAFPFQLTDSGDNGTHLTGTVSGTMRYVGIYITNAGVGQDWRCYKLGNNNAFPNNVKGQTVAFWKLDGGEEPPEPSDKEKVEYEAALISFPEEVDEETTFNLSFTGTKYEDVSIAWETDSVLYAHLIAGPRLLLTLPESGEVTVHVTVTLSLNDESKVLVFPITIKGPEAPVHYETVEEILTALYALEEGQTLPGGPYELEGKITTVNKAYSDGKINVTIVMDGFNDYPVLCYELTAEAENTEMLTALEVLKKGDTIKVKGELKDYNGTKEFVSGCLLLAYTAAPEEEEVTWSKVEWSAITAEDVIAITMTKGDETWVLPGTNGTTSAPTAVKVTVANNKITTKGSEDYGWIKEAVEAGGYSLRLASATTNQYLYLYKDDNNGVRVGSTAAFPFQLTDSGDNGTHLTGTVSGTMRYVGIYITNAGVGQDWRCYKLGNNNAFPNNVKGQTVEFWKLGDGGEEPPVGPTDKERVETAAAALVLDEGPFAENTEVLLPVPEDEEITVTWESSNPTAFNVSDGVKMVVTQQAEFAEATVTATLTLREATATATFHPEVKPAEPEVYSFVSEVATEAGYKLGFKKYNETEPKVYYFNGEVNNGYLQTSEDPEEAVDLLLEETRDGYIISFNDGAKAVQYLDVDASGSKPLFKLTNEKPSKGFGFDPAFAALTYNDDEKGLFVAGTYGTFTTISLSSATSYWNEYTVDETQFPARFYELLKEGEDPNEAERLADEKAALELTETTFTEAKTIDLPTVTDVTITWNSSSVYAAVSDGKLVITLPESEDQTVNLDAVMTLGEATATKRFTLTIKAPSQEATWTKVALEDIKPGDIIAISMTKNGTTWLLSGANGTTGAPKAVVVTVTDNKITTENKNEFAFEPMAVDVSFVFRYAAVKDAYHYLYVINQDNNNGVRVGEVPSNGDAEWILDKDYENGYLRSVTTDRYLGVYIPTSGDPDWRSYKIKNNTFPSNITNQTLEFWKLDGGEEPPSSSFDVTIWIREGEEAFWQERIENYNANNTDHLIFNPTFVAVDSPDVLQYMQNDPENGGDLFRFNQTEFAQLKLAGLLSVLDAEAAAKVNTENSEGALKAARTADGSLYAYPMSINNGYFLYYDKSVISDADAESVEAILLDCENARKNFAFETWTSAYYLASWFFGAGCVSEWTIDETGKFVAVNDDFNSAKGLIAARALYDLMNSSWYVSTSSSSRFEEENCAAIVSGTWDYETMKALLGDNLGVTDLPSFMVDLQNYHLGSFSGSELMGVRPQTDPEKEAALHKLAQYLTGEACQLERHDEFGFGPSNLAAQDAPEVQEDPALAALLLQSQYAEPLRSIHASWWEIGVQLANDIEATNGTSDEIQAALQLYEERIQALLNRDGSFTVIGEINGTFWDTDFPMTEVSEGVWVSDDVFYLTAGTEFKCRQDLAWDVNYGVNGENFVVETDGTYRIRLTLTEDSGTIDLIPVETLSVGHGTNYSGVFSPFYSGNAYDSDVVRLTQLTLITTDRMGGVVYNAIEGETIDYHGTNYLYTGPADLSVHYDKSTGMTTYTATLRPGMKFSDGVEVTADDLIFTYYTLCDPSYDGNDSVSSHNILGLRNYQNQVTDEVYSKYSALAYSIYTAGHDGYIENDQYSEGLYNAYWNKLDELGLEATQGIINYIMINFCSDEYAESYLGPGTTAEQIRANEGLQVAFAMVLWGYGQMFEGEFEDSLGRVYHETWPTVADFYKNIYEYYDGDLEKAWNYEAANGEDPYGMANTWFILTFGPQDPAMVGHGFPNIEGIKKLDKYTVQITTLGYDASAVYSIFGVDIAPMHYYGDEAKYDYENNKFGFDFGDLSKQKSRNSAPMGAGPYKFVSYLANTINFEANENYFRGCPKIGAIQFVGSDNVFDGIEDGTLDCADAAGSATNYNIIRAINTNAELTGDVITTSLIDHNGYGYIGINAATINVNGDPDSDESKALRKALATIISVFREETVASYYGDAAKVIEYPISSTSWAAPQPSDSGYQTAFSKWWDGTDAYREGMSRDERIAAATDCALSWFEQAGYTVADGEIVDAPLGGPLSVTYLSSGGHPCDGAIRQAAEVLSGIGFDLVFEDSDFSSVMNAIDNNTHELWAMAWGTTIDPDMYQIFHSNNIGSSGSNHYHIDDADLDELILDARMSDDQSYRKQIYKQCLDIIMDWGVVIPVYQRQNCYVFSTQRIDISTVTPDITTYWDWLNDIENLELK